MPEYASKLDAKSGTDNPKTAVLLYVGQADMDTLTGALLEHWDELSDDKVLKKLVRDLIKTHKE